MQGSGDVVVRHWGSERHEVGRTMIFKCNLETCRQCPQRKPPSCPWCISLWYLEVFCHNKTGFHIHISDPPYQPHTYDSEVIIFVNIFLLSFMNISSLSPYNLEPGLDISDMTTEDSRERSGTGGLCSEDNLFHCHRWGHMKLVHIGLDILTFITLHHNQHDSIQDIIQCR